MIKKFLFTVLLGLSAIASSLTIDSEVPAIKIKDQFEKEHTIDANVKTILFASDKGTSDILKDYLLSKDADILTKNNAVYVADISGMPSLISKFVALPKMKKYPFSVLLLDDTNKDNFSKEEGKIIVYTLDNSKVTNIAKISTKEELEAIIK
ncbi:hypothetical protein [Arcobacter cloacae]|uniref:Uncharacterized protein n=1 Tax=Arcobacter cloacae TaxID=1054034 RepID=A0A6M8NQW5_9BACT|nr:hypothetical protein [Arcobacter cloacae]NCB12819.1 hypothetical protein [Erysipelotrichia bacterium]QKF91092.1 hypothetical protein ACLO_2658 [Arcobacter cloacae]RXI41222.1 hypothetical protein CP963_07440 [Arcobacter cloacae]